MNVNWKYQALLSIKLFVQTMISLLVEIQERCVPKPEMRNTLANQLKSVI